MPLKPSRAFNEPATSSGFRVVITNDGRAPKRSSAAIHRGKQPAHARVLDHEERGVAVLRAQYLVEFADEGVCLCGGEDRLGYRRYVVPRRAN